MPSQTPEKKRQPKVRLPNAAETCGVPLPAIVIRTIRVPQGVDGTTADAPPMLYPHRPAKNWMGPDAAADITKAIANLLAVYSIVRFRLLQANGATTLDATMTVEQAAAQSFTLLRKSARKGLSRLTAFDNDKELVAWSRQPTQLFRIPVDAPRGETLQDASLDIVSLLQKALARTRRVLAAVHETQLSPDQSVGEALARAFAPDAHLTATDCYRVALFADINPAPIWRAHAHYDQFYELARFIGRIDRGAKAMMAAHQQEMIRNALAADNVAGDEALAGMRESLRSAIEHHFGMARFEEVLASTRRNQGILVVDRRTRRLRYRTDGGWWTRIFGRDRTT